MKPVRVGLSIAIVLVLAFGYAASQRSAFAGTAHLYAVEIDSTTIMMLSQTLLVGAFILSLLPAREAGQK